MSTKKRKSGMMAQQTGSTKMIKKEEKVLNSDVRKQETNDWSSTKANADTNQRDYVPRRSIKIKSSPENPHSSRSGQTKSSPQKEASTRAAQTTSAEVRLPLRNKELANLVVNINSGSIVKPKTTRSDRQIFAAIKLEVPCDDDSLLSQQRKSTARLIKKEENNDNVSMLVHGNRSAQDPHKSRSVVEKNDEEIEVQSVRTIRAKSVPRGIQARSEENRVVSTRSDAIDRAPPVKTPSKDAPNRCKTIESVQKEIVKAEPLKKEQIECSASMIVHLDTTPSFTSKRSASVKNRDKSVDRSIPRTTSKDDVVTKDADAVHSTSAVEKSHKATPKQHRMTESSWTEADVSSKEQIVPRDAGISMSLPVSDNISSMSESDSSENDRSSDEDFDPTIKRRKRRSIWDLDSEPDNRIIPRVPSVKNMKGKSGTPKGILASPAAITNGSSPADREVDKTKKSTTEHNVTPHEQRRFKCDVCDERFSRKDHIPRHKLTHTGERSFKCGTCKKRFALKHNLQTHERIHTGERPYACKFCDKRFIRSDDLQRHMRTHTGERPFACSICNKRFNTSSNRIVHERIHTGKKPYTCSICNKRFNQSSSLRRHKRTHSYTSTEDLPDVTHDYMDQPSSKEAISLSDNARNQKIRYRSKSIEYIVQKMAKQNPGKMYLVWSKKFSMELASAVSQSGRNCLLIVKKFKPTSFPDVFNLSKMLHTFSIEIGPSAKPIRLFSFGGMAVPEKIIHNGGFKSLTKLESKLSKFARSQRAGIVNMFKHSENNKGWYESLRSSLKEECIITNKG